MSASLARLALLGGMLAGGSAFACSVVAPNLSFGLYDPVGTTVATTSGAIVVTCSTTPPPRVRIEVGPSAVSGGFSPRRMRQAAGADTLAYNLYVDPLGILIWGDGSAGTFTRTQSVPRNRPWMATLFARMPAGQDVSPGSYSDTLLVTIAF